MTSLYDQYFAGKDISEAKAKLMYDIKNRVIYGQELSELISGLEKNGLTNERPFTKKPKNLWTDDYARFLATGFASGYFSREYLNHCAEVAEYLHNKKKRSKTLLLGTAALIVIVLIIAFLRALE